MRTNQRPPQVLIAVVFSLIVSLIAPPSSAQQSVKGKAAADATTALLQMNSHYQQTPAAQKAQLLTQLRAMASQRQQTMSSLIQTNPGDVLRVAVPANIRGTMPPAVQTFVEQQVQAQGTLEILHSDFGSPAKGLTGGKFYYHLKTATEILALHFAEKAPTHLLTGSVVRANGVRVGNDVALACCSGTSNSNLQTVSAIAPNTFGAQSTLVILVNFQDNTTQPYTLSNAYDVVFNQTSKFDMENSFQQSWLTGEAVGWYTLPLSSANCPDNNVIAADANQAAAAAGVNLANYTRYVYAFPSVSCYGWWGLGTVGGSPSEAWINGSFQLKVVGHEMGHNLGLYHSHGMSCGSTQTLCSSPTISEYGDSIDMMGNPSYGHFNAFQKERLGWLNYGASPPINLVQSSGTYSIGPYENQDGITKALKFLKSTDPMTGANTWYYVQYNQALGFDSFLSNDSNVLGGVLVHIGTDNDGNSNDLLNMAPSLNNFYYSALDVGQTFIDPTAGVTMQTVSTNSAGASVSVTFGTPACAHFNPMLSISPYQSQTVQAGAQVLYTLTLVNSDNAGCTSSTFNFGASVPSGWSAGFSNPSLALAPGASGSTTLQVTSPNGISSGIYSVNASATNSSATSFSSSTSATYVLNTAPCTHANPAVSFSPPIASAAAGTAQLYVMNVTNEDNSSCNSSVFNLTGSVPSGWTSALGTPSLNLAPGALGQTSLTVTSPTNAAGGSYSFSGTAANTVSSTYSGTGSGTYTIPGGCTRGNPTLSVSPSQGPSVAPGTPVNFTVSVKNNDASSCASSNFNLGNSVPSGWSGSWGTAALSIAPGSTNSATLQVTSTSSTAAGSYDVTATASNASASSYVGSAPATYVASTGGTSAAVSVATNSSTYSGGQTVKITVAVTSGGSPIPGAAVTVTVTAPNGSGTQLAGTTGSNGTTTVSYRLKKQAPSGTYQVQANTNSTPSSPLALASTTFMVQ